MSEHISSLITLLQYSVPSMSLFHNNLPKYSQNYVKMALLSLQTRLLNGRGIMSQPSSASVEPLTLHCFNDGRRRRTASCGRPCNLMIISSNWFNWNYPMFQRVSHYLSLSCGCFKTYADCPRLHPPSPQAAWSSRDSVAWTHYPVSILVVAGEPLHPWVLGLLWTLRQREFEKMWEELVRIAERRKEQGRQLQEMAAKQRIEKVSLYER